MTKYFLFLSAFIFSAFIGFSHAESATNRFYILGNAVQGNMLYGKVTPGSKVIVGDKKVQVSSKGDFVFGIPRDAKGTLKVKVTFPSGITDTRPLLIQAKKWQIQALNDLPQKHVNPPAEELQKIKIQAADVKNARGLNTKTSSVPGCFLQPVKGIVSSVFGSQRILNGEPKNPHLGIDIAAKTGTEVKASAAGTVSYAEPDNYYNGQMVIIDHGYGISSSYSHMSKINVTVGQKVKKGEVIGLVGSTGRSTGPHLHWGVSWLNTPINPQNVLKVSAKRCSSGKQKRVTKNQ